MDTQLTFFTADEKFAFARNDATHAKHYQAKYYLEATFPLDAEKPVLAGMYVGYFNRDGKFIMFIVNKPTTNYVKKTVSFTAELAAMVELREEHIIEDRRPSNCQAGLAVSVAIEDTIWELGTVEDTIIASNHFYYQNPWAALIEIAEKYSCGFDFRVEVSDSGIVGRYVDVLQDIGRDVGLRLEIEKNVDDVNIDIDDTEVRTALYGRGKGEEVGTNSNGDATYGRRINFGDLVWSKANGDPCDKPAGQEWLEDVEATALYGRNGRKRIGVVIFENCEDQEKLIRLTWEHLQTIKQPKVTVKATPRYLEDNFGYSGEAIRLGDYAAIIIDDTQHVHARVTSADVDLVNEKKTDLVIGNSVLSITDMYASSANKIDENAERIDIGSQIAARNPELYKGILNTMVTQILSTGTRMYTDPLDGSFIFETDDGTAAVKLTGRGILISDQKNGDDFVWTTALNGGGMAADVINTGVLKASLVKILGTDSFYWDSQAIFIFDENDATKNRQIRIGKYDGKNYGIGYTKDGGLTWQNAIGFDGVTFSATGFTKNYVQMDEPVAENVGDIWTQLDVRTWQTISAQTWAQIRATTWGDTSGALKPKTYVWDGSKWNLSSDVQTVSKLKSTVSLNEKEFSAEFNRIGLCGKQTGITKIDETGVSVSHSNIGGSSLMNADGFKLRDASGKTLGGLISVNGQLYAAVQALMNPSYPDFRVGIADRDFEGSQFGLHWIYNETEQGAIYAYDGGMRHDVNGQFGMFAENFVIMNKNDDCGVRFVDGEIWFYFLDDDGDFQSWSIRDMWNNMPKG